jgi:hypothetical protein
MWCIVIQRQFCCNAGNFQGACYKASSMATGRVPEALLVKDRLDICKLLLLSYVFLNCISSVYADVGAAPLQQGSMKSQVSQTAEGTVGNLTLPDPAEINAYIRTNTTLGNVLLPAYPPLQLMKCEVYLLQMKILFNFYTAEHPGGCAEAPGFAKLPKSAYSERQQFWLFGVRSWLSSWSAVLASLVGFAFSACCHDRFELKTFWRSSSSRTPGSQHGRAVSSRSLFLLLFTFVVRSIIGPLICGSGIGCILVLAAAWVRSDVLHPVHLPDPATVINPLLLASNTTLSLRRCSVLDSNHFDFLLHDNYIGMPGSLCP